MALKLALSKDEHGKLDDAQKALYTESGDGYALDVEEDGRLAEANAKVDEFRKNNKALNTKIANLEKPDPARADLAERFDKLQEQFDTQQTDLKGERDKNAAVEFKGAVSAAGKKLGLHPEAVDDVTVRAQGAGFKMVDGAAVAYDKDGNVQKSSRHQGVQLTLVEWISAQRPNAPHLFRNSQGAPRPGGGPNASTENPGMEIIRVPVGSLTSEQIDKIGEGKAVHEPPDES